MSGHLGDKKAQQVEVRQEDAQDLIQELAAQTEIREYVGLQEYLEVQKSNVELVSLKKANSRSF